MNIKLETLEPDRVNPKRRLVGCGITGAWTTGIPELLVGDAHFIYIGDEVLECKALTKCKGCSHSWGLYSLCPTCGETAKRARVVRHRRLAAFNALRERHPKTVPNSTIWEMVDLIQELSS